MAIKKGEKMKLFNLTKEEIIETNERSFNVYAYLPTIIAIIIAILFFLWGIIDPAINRLPHRWYGLFRTDTFLGAVVLWWIIGAVVTALNYFIYKIILAPTVLNIYYLAEIIKNTKKTDENK